MKKSLVAPEGKKKDQQVFVIKQKKHPVLDKNKKLML